MAPSPSRDRAKEFLTEHLLGRGPIPSPELKERAVAEGIPLRTLQRCAQEIGVTFIRQGPNPALWALDSLPEAQPTKEILSLGAGVQSTTLALLACEEVLHLDAAVFADTGWEPASVYAHLDRLEAHMAARGIPLVRVSAGNIRDDALNPKKRFVSLPYYTLHEGKKGMARRQCTREYKIEPIQRAVRKLLGAPPPKYRSVPRGASVNLWIGFSTDEIGRVNDRPDNWYTTKRYPLLELNMSRSDCAAYLADRGWMVAKSACVGCPFHTNAIWRDLRDNRPDEWQDAVEFDRAIRKGGYREGRDPLKGEAFLHHSCVPLDQADLEENYDSDPDGCSPFGCRSGKIAGSF